MVTLAPGESFRPIEAHGPYRHNLWGMITWGLDTWRPTAPGIYRVRFVYDTSAIRRTEDFPEDDTVWEQFRAVHRERFVSDWVEVVVR